jgi:hypothetical protein
MNLYQKLFGLNLMIPADDGTGGGASADRGDDWTPTTEVPPAAATTEETVEDDLKVATGEHATEEPPRDAAGKFAPKAKSDEGATIPKARFDSAVQKERERAETAERLLAEATRANNQIQRNADVSQLEAKVQELRAAERKATIDNDEEKAAQLSSEADRLNRQIAIQQAGDMTAAAKDAALESMRMELAVENIETNYPQLDENSEEFDQDLTDDVLDKQRGYMERERLSPSKALLKAVKYVMGRQAPAAATEPAKTGLSAASKGQDRKSAAVAKNLDAAARQPASTKPVGADSDKHGQTKDIPEASQMTFAEFSALPDATKSKMRGDYV